MYIIYMCINMRIRRDASYLFLRPLCACACTKRCVCVCVMGCVCGRIGGAYNEWAEWLQFKAYALLSSNGFVKLFIFATFSTLLVALGAWLLKNVDPTDDSPWTQQLFKACLSL